MVNLYHRLDELEGVIRVLTKDKRSLCESCSQRTMDEIDGTVSGARRACVRAVFALVEAVVEQHKRLLLDLRDNDLVSIGDEILSPLGERGMCH